MILNDRQIRALIRQGMIKFGEMREKVRTNSIGAPATSYGISSFGYDIRLGDDIKLLVPMPGKRINPKHFDQSLLITPPICTDTDGTWFELPAHSFGLGVSVEEFDIPKNVLCLVIGKSTYARSAMILNCTPLEPGWRGHITLELQNPTLVPIQVFIGEGIGQVVFLNGEEPEHSYASRYYQDQGNMVVTAKV